MFEEFLLEFLSGHKAVQGMHCLNELSLKFCSLQITFTTQALKRVNITFTVGDEQSISYLPLSHIAAQLADIYIPIITAATVWFAGKDALKGGLATTLNEVKPTFFFGVPR